MRSVNYLLVGAMLVSPLGTRVVFSEEFDVCGIESAMAFDEWQEWRKLTPVPIRSREHIDWVIIYVDDLARSSDLASTGAYAECAKVVKVHFSNARGTDILRLMLMAKMAAGFDPDHGDWWYGMYDGKAGTSVIEEGAIANCIVCHQRASDTDYIFASEVARP